MSENTVTFALTEAELQTTIANAVEKKMQAMIPSFVSAVAAATNAQHANAAATNEKQQFQLIPQQLLPQQQVIQVAEDSILNKLMTPSKWSLTAKIAAGVAGVAAVAGIGYMCYDKFFVGDDD